MSPAVEHALSVWWLAHIAVVDQAWRGVDGMDARKEAFTATVHRELHDRLALADALNEYVNPPPCSTNLRRAA